MNPEKVDDVSTNEHPIEEACRRYHAARQEQESAGSDDFPEIPWEDMPESYRQSVRAGLMAAAPTVIENRARELTHHYVLLPRKALRRVAKTLDLMAACGSEELERQARDALRSIELHTPEKGQVTIAWIL